VKPDPGVGSEYLRASAAPGARFLWGWGLGFAALALALLYPVLDGAFFADDWELYLARPASHIARAFLEVRPYETYRPLQLLLVATSQALVGYTTLPVHLLNLALHAGLALLVLRSLLSLGAPRLGAVLGGLYVSVSQLAASAVGGNDTISLTLSTLAGSSALLLLRPFAPQRAARPGLAALAFAVALFSKESSLGYLPLLALLAWRHGSGRAGGARKAALWSACFAAVALMYLALRACAGGAVPDLATGQQARLGANIPMNAALLGFAALVPLSTTRIFVGLSEHRWLWPLAGVLSWLALVAFLTRGMARAERPWLVAGFALASAVLLTPVLVLTHVSELYAYGVLPFTALLFGWSTGSLLSRSSGALERIGAMTFATLVLSANAWAARQDALGMARSGALAGALMPQVLERVRTLPPGGVAVLVDPPPRIPNYSVYQSSGFRGVLLSPRQILEMTGRADVQMLGVAAGEPLPKPCVGCVFLTLEPGNRVLPMP